MKYTLLIILCGLATLSASAQDRMLSYTYQTNVLDKGDFDLEFWNTLAAGKSGDFSPYVFGRKLEQRLELEFGLGKKVQTSFYLNTDQFHFADTSSDEIQHDLSLSFSNEWKWKLTDPVANKIGSALYAEFTFGGEEIELEGKIILDKKLPKDLFALNLVAELELENEIETGEGTEVEWEREPKAEIDLAYMHFIKPEFGLGIEIKNNHAFSDHGEWISAPLFAGPSFHASIGRCFINFAALPQITNLHTSDEAPGTRDLVNFEACEFRVFVGYSFWK